ncbi:MAG: AAA domain (dynein-related subfamily) [Synergistetes bacterium ADurb.BinA166]|nr:MAG: AAA domain (dynein-related subfamily) [Synergistetes bacterium ADurb.BinA166]
MLTGVFEIDQSTYKQVLSFNIQTGGNLLVLGMAGTGKTEMAQEAVKAAEFEYIYLNLSVLEAPDLVGLPSIVDGNVVYAMPAFMPKMDGSKPKVLIVDEIDKAKPELQNPLLELFQSHTMNGVKLNIQAIIATGNLPDEGAFSQPISHALTNRCQAFRITHNFEAWASWAKEAEVNPLVIGFLSKNREYLSMAAAEGDPTAYCRPSPRSWTMAARDLDRTTSKDSVDFQTLLVAGRVGISASVKFKVWLDHYRHVEPIVDKLVKDGTHPSTNEMPIDKQIVCAISAVNAIVQESRAQEKTADRAKASAAVQGVAARVFSWIKTLPSEFQIGAVKSTLNMKLIQEHKLTGVKDCMDTYLSIKKAMG